MHTMGASRRWFKYLSSCHPQGGFRLNSGFVASKQSSYHHCGHLGATRQWMGNLIPLPQFIFMSQPTANTQLPQIPYSLSSNWGSPDLEITNNLVLLNFCDDFDHYLLDSQNLFLCGCESLDPWWQTLLLPCTLALDSALGLVLSLVMWPILINKTRNNGMQLVHVCFFSQFLPGLWDHGQVSMIRNDRHMGQKCHFRWDHSMLASPNLFADVKYKISAKMSRLALFTCRSIRDKKFLSF